MSGKGRSKAIAHYTERTANRAMHTVGFGDGISKRLRCARAFSTRLGSGGPEPKTKIVSNGPPAHF